MPIPRVVRRWNKAGLNRVTGRIFPWVPGFGVIVHRGRLSGREYRTPVNVFAAEDGYVFALTYGADTDWVKNVLAEGGCELRARGRVIRLTEPRLYHDEARQGIRCFERQTLRLIGVADFLSLKTQRHLSVRHACGRSGRRADHRMARVPGRRCRPLAAAGSAQ